jgi:hypothetical protein
MTKDRRIIEFCTKAGNLFPNHFVIAPVPDYDLVMVAFMARPKVSGATTCQVIGYASTASPPIIEQAGKAKA